MFLLSEKILIDQFIFVAFFIVQLIILGILIRYLIKFNESNKKEISKRLRFMSWYLPIPVFLIS